MRAIVAEDDATARKILVQMLAPYAACDEFEDGTTALRAFEQAYREGNPYQMACLDIEMPGLWGDETLERFRELETELGIDFGDGAKVIMTTTHRDPKRIVGTFRRGCEAYIVKPVTLERLIKEMRTLALI